MKMHAINNATGSSSIFLVGNGGLVRTYNNDSSSQYVHFNVEGNISPNTVINLAGNVTTSTDPSMIGTPITITADTSTGNMALAFEGNTYTGTGRVLIKYRL
ncbi:MAG: hypothetical protein ACREA3_06315 [Nitrosotalea sp.]